jgi:thiol-disulfide isomerase/thioredoxin
MSTIRIIGSLAILVLCAAVGQSQEKKIVMTHVKYDGLKQEVLKHRGKVVVIDFWATWCPSCMEAFPKFIEYQKKYADKGLVVIAVSIDSMEKEGAVERANRFLNKHKSPLRNLLLDEPPEVLEKQFAFESLPFYYVFDRQGKWVRFRAADYKDSGVPYDELEKTIVQLLNEK